MGSFMDAAAWKMWNASVDMAEESKKLNNTMSWILNEMIIFNDNYAKVNGLGPIPRKEGLTGGERNV